MSGEPLTISIFSVIDHYPTLPRPIARLYAEVTEQCALADELGYDTFFVAEHHFSEYGVFPNPAVWMAAAAQRTRRIRLAPAVAVLPFHDPRALAEDYAMVDLLSGGRLSMGVGSGYLAHEFAGFAVDAAEKRERFDEALSIITRLWAGETVTHKGRFWELDGVTLNVRPAGPVPVYVASLRPEVAYHVGRAGHAIMTVPYATVDRFEEVAGMLAEYRRGRAESPVAAPGGEGEAVVALHTYVADTAEQARAEAAAAFDLYVETRRYAKRQTYDDIMRSGLSLMGSVEEVADKMVRLHGMGVRHLMLLQNFGALPADLVHRSMTRVMREVMPRVRERLA